MRINNRRYIGCKTKLLDFIYKTITSLGYDNSNTFFDVFAGTGVVAYMFAEKGYKTILNDNLYSNYIAYKAFLGSGEIRKEVIKKEIEFFNNINSEELEDNYFSQVYGEKYFSINDAKKIGYIRETIENRKKLYTEREYYYFITSLIYSVDRIANTVGHYESFLKTQPEEHGVQLQELEISDKLPKSIIYNEDANLVVKKQSADIVYLDPPYNARQYVNFYHVLENLARWNKPTEFEGNSMKFKRNELKSGYCRNTAPELMMDLVSNIKAKIIVVSYNNTYKAGSISSVNMITEDQMYNILKTRGKVEKKEISYRAFSAGKTNLANHKEYLYICEVE